jgi:transcriptional regulator with XRE-family HTH domain
MGFGSSLKSFREQRGLGLRELARKAKISAAFLSQVEAEKAPTPPSEKKLRALARALGVEPEVLMAEAGRLPEDVIKIIQRHPDEYIGILRDLRRLGAGALRTVRNRIPVTLMEICVSDAELESFRQLMRKGPIRQYEITLRSESGQEGQKNNKGDTEK